VETLTLTELGARMARRWRTLLVGALVGLALGAAAHAALPTRYEAITVVHVDAADPAQVDMAAEQAVATSRRVTAEALDALGGGDLTIRALEDAAGATVVKDSRLLRVSCAGSDPRAATRRADALAHAYLAVRSVDAATGGPVVEATVVDPARTPSSPVGPGGPATALGGTVLGLLLVCPIAARPRGGRAS
jgi:uncharacterized protein involved in exopolysaccharide biosynthesis